MRQPHVGPKRNSDGPCALVDWTAEEEIDEVEGESLATARRS